MEETGPIEEATPVGPPFRKRLGLAAGLGLFAGIATGLLQVGPSSPSAPPLTLSRLTSSLTTATVDVWHPAGPRLSRRPYEPTPVADLGVGATVYVADTQRDFMLLPPQGSGYYHFGGSDRIDEDAWGLPETIACIELVGEIWHARYPEGPRLGIGDISRRRGGRFPPHREHRNGLDIDVRPVHRSAEARAWVKLDAYDAARTAEAIELFRQTCTVEVILFNDRKLAKTYDYVETARGHDNHFHVALDPQLEQPKSVRARAARLQEWARPYPTMEAPRRGTR